MMETAYLLEQLVAMGTTIIVVTHDSELIHACCSRKFCISYFSDERHKAVAVSRAPSAVFVDALPGKLANNADET